MEELIMFKIINPGIYDWDDITRNKIYFGIISNGSIKFNDDEPCKRMWMCNQIIIKIIPQSPILKDLMEVLEC